MRVSSLRGAALADGWRSILNYQPRNVRLAHVISESTADSSRTVHYRQPATPFAATCFNGALWVSDRLPGEGLPIDNDMAPLDESGWCTERHRFTRRDRRDLTKLLKKWGKLGSDEEVRGRFIMTHKNDHGFLLRVAEQLRFEGVVDRAADYAALVKFMRNLGLAGIPSSGEALTDDSLYETVRWAGSDAALVMHTRYKPVGKKQNPVADVQLPDGIAPTPWAKQDAPAGPRMTQEAIDVMLSESQMLLPNERKLVEEMLWRREKAFSFTLAQRGQVRPEICPLVEVHTKPHIAWKRRPLRIPYQQLDQVINFLTEQLDAGIMEPGFGPYSASCFVVPKKDGSIRFIQDLQPLNAVTIRDAGVPPPIEECVDFYAGRAIYSPADCHSFYNQFVVAAEHRDKMAVSTPLGLMRMVTLPMGWTNSVPIAQRSSIRILREFIPHKIRPFLDDYCMAGARTEDADHREVSPGVRKFVADHIKDLDRFLEVIIEAGVTLHGTKSRFCVAEATILGHRCFNGGRKPTKDKVDKLRDWTPLRSVRDVKSFIGLATFFRRYVQDFALRADALYNAMKRSHDWGDPGVIDAAQRDIIEALSSFPVLRPLRHGPGAPTPGVSVDSSRLGWGGYVWQEEDGERFVVSFLSGRFVERESRFVQHKLEILGTLRCLRAAHHYIWGQPFILEVDANSMIGSINRGESVDEHAQRWLLAIRAHNPILVHVPGRKHVVADVLSRWGVGDVDEEDVERDEEFVDTVLDLNVVGVGAVQYDIALSVMSFNCNSWRNLVKRGGASTLEKILGFDVVMLQEIRMGKKDFSEVHDDCWRRTHDAWSVGRMPGPSGLGKSGVAVLLRKDLGFDPDTAVVVSRFTGWTDEQMEGRYIEVSLGSLTLVSIYVPMGGGVHVDRRRPQKLRFLRAAIDRFHVLKSLGQTMIIGGDWNVSEEEIDIDRRVLPLITTGFEDDERALLRELTATGFVDVFRTLKPRRRSWTVWHWGQGHLGMRFDTVRVVGAAPTKAWHDASVGGSDHIPVVCEIVFAVWNREPRQIPLPTVENIVEVAVVLGEEEARRWMEERGFTEDDVMNEGKERVLGE